MRGLVRGAEIILSAAAVWVSSATEFTLCNGINELGIFSLTAPAILDRNEVGVFTLAGKSSARLEGPGGAVEVYGFRGAITLYAETVTTLCGGSFELPCPLSAGDEWAANFSWQVPGSNKFGTGMLPPTHTYHHHPTLPP